MISLSTGGFAGILCVGSLKEVFQNGVMHIRSGVQPADADAAEIGELIAVVTPGGVSFTAGAAFGINFKDTITKSISQSDAEDVWLGEYLIKSNMGWFRIYDNAFVEGASTTACRIDGSIGISRSDMIVESTATTVGGSLALPGFQLNFSIC